MIENVLNGLFNGLISLVQSVVDLFLTPIDNLINSYLPSVGNIFSSIGTFLGQCMTYVGWLIDALCIPNSLLVFLGLYWTFKLTVPLLVSGIKTIIKWFKVFKIGG